MKIAIITANVGSIDSPIGFPLQNTNNGENEIEFFYYYDHNLPVPLPNLPNRLKAKYPKIKSHKFLDHDVHIWIDGRVKIQSKDFVNIMLEKLENVDVALFKHKERSNVFEELDYILDRIKDGNHYLLSRYGNQQLEVEREFYEKYLNSYDHPLYACTIFARKNNRVVNKAFDEWWEKCIEYSYFDQTMFTYIASKFALHINPLEWDEFKKVLTVQKHLL